MQQTQYAGFWARTGAALIDTLLYLIIVAPVLTLIYGKGYWLSEQWFHGVWDGLLNYILPFLSVLLFWRFRGATPGKLVLKIRIVDAKTGGNVPTSRLIIRYFAYLVSMIPLLAGFFWVAFDQRKQSWHDKLAGTLTIRDSAER